MLCNGKIQDSQSRSEILFSFHNGIVLLFKLQLNIDKDGTMVGRTLEALG